MSTGSSTPLWVGFIPVVRRVELRLALVNIEPLRIGAGRSASPASPADLPLLRERVHLGDGRIYELPVIPGSSLKGVLRTASMTVARTCGLRAHSGVEDNCVEELCGDSHVFDKVRDPRGRASSDVVRRVILGFCPLCQLYGAPSLSSRITVSEFVPASPEVRTGIKTGVAIDRRKGTAATERRALYNVEYVEPGTVFKGTLRLVNTPNWMLSLLAASLTLLDEGWVKIGGFKSRGMGLVSVARESLILRVHGHVKGNVLDVLDAEVDEEEELEGCTAAAGGLECSGEAAYGALGRLAASWSRYCSRLAKALEKRTKEAASLCTFYAGDTGWGEGA